MIARVLRFRRVLLAPIALGALLVPAACGGGESSAAEETATQPPATVTSTATSEPGGNAGVAQDGDRVTVHYHGTLDSGEVFDSSRGGAPLRPFVLGTGAVIAGFDNAVRGLVVGETVTVRIEPADAYGERDESLILEFPAADAPQGLLVGDQVVLNGGQPAVVLEVTDQIVRIDANHALAGQALTFEIELVALN